MNGRPWVAGLCLLLLAGCGSRMAGTYRAEARQVAGKPESTQPGYTLADIRQKLRDDPRTLALLRNGRYSKDNGVNEGTWRVEGDTLILHDDTSQGVHIQAALQLERKWPIGPNGEIISTSDYCAYNVELVYRRHGR